MSLLNSRKKKGGLLAAFKEGDIAKVMQYAKNISDKSKASIPIIVRDYTKSINTMTPLHLSIQYANYHLCELLIEDGVSLSGDIGKQPRPLSFALNLKQHDIAELLIKAGADVNLLEKDNNTYPLFWAIQENSPPYIIEQIISAGFPVNSLVFRETFMTAIHCAALENNIEAAEVLLKHSVDLNLINSLGETALNIAVRRNFPNMARFLIKNGAALENRNASMCPLFSAIRFEHKTMVETLLDLGASIEEGWVGKEIVPPLQFALSYLNIDIVMLLIDRGANVKAKHILSHETALHVAATYLGLKHKGNSLQTLQVTISRRLIEKGADVNAKDIDGKTPLDSAICSENTELCKLLLREGAEITGNGWIRGDGILSNRFEYIACVSTFKCPELMNLCLERGCDYNFRDKHGLSPYHCALAKHNPEMVKVFWQHGCPYDQPEHIPGKMKTMLWYNPDAEDKKIVAIQTDFIDGIKNNRLDMVVNSLKNGAVAKGCSIEIPSTLHYLAANGNHIMARILLEKGVPVNIINNKGQTPLFLAVQKNQYQICLLFLEFGACFSTITSGAINIPSQENKQICKLFKNIKMCFKFIKLGNSKVLDLLQKYINSGDIVMLRVLMNCVNRKGLTLIGYALSLGHEDIARHLMLFRLLHIKTEI